MLVKACDTISSLKAELDTLKAEMVKTKSDLVATKAALYRAETKPAAPAVAAARIPTGPYLTNAQRESLYEQMDKLPEAEQRAFYLANIKGRIVV
jgi:hypothetical protein